MKEYKKLTIKEKAELLDKLIRHAQNIDNNFYVIIKRNSPEVQEALKASKHFLNVVQKEAKL